VLLCLVALLDMFAVSCRSTAVLGGELKYVDVVEPPKFITAKHVSAMFERLGFDGTGGQKIFAALSEAIARRRQGSVDGDEHDGATAGGGLVSRDSLGGNPTTPTTTPAAAANSKSPNAALALAMGSMEDVPPTPPRKSESSSNVNNAASGGAGADAALPVPATPKDLREGGYRPDGTAAKMDFHDFVRACEIDDILINVLINNLRGGIIQLIQRAETQAAAMGAEAGEGGDDLESMTPSSDATTPKRSKSFNNRSMSTNSERLASNLINNELSAAALSAR
jgi:hypothetical protein